MGTPNRRRRIAWLATPIVLGISLSAVVVSRAASSPGCDFFEEGSIQESQLFAPVESRLTQPLDPPIRVVTQEAVPVPEDAFVPSIDGLPHQWATVSPNGAVYQYFLAVGIDEALTVSEFRAAGGIQLDRDPVDDGEDFAAYLLETLGERVTKIEIGDHAGALVWADPLINGVRPHYLYWSDGSRNYALMADRSPEDLVNLARDLVCNAKIGV